VAGNEKSGRRRMSIEEHLDAGTYRADRQGPIPDSAEGLPVMPRCLPVDGRACWKAVVNDLISRGMAKGIDTLALQQMCEMWALYRAALKLAKKFPAEPSARTSVTSYLREFQAIGRRFGLTFGDRQKLKAAPAGKEKATGIPSRQRA
jgi:phage terminase small subunit